MGRGRPKKYFTEEERKAADREYKRQYYQNNKNKILEQKKQYRQDNKEYLKEQKKQYYQDNKEYLKEYYKQRYQDNKDKMLECYKQYRQTQMGRAVYLISNYKHSDKKYNRGECTLTPKWMVENIFSKPCHYCGEEGWEIMGCDRIDNSKPHTPDNVVPCCWECNLKKQKRDYEEFMLETILF